MYKIIYSENSLKDLRRIDRSVSQRIISKILFFSRQTDISPFSKPLKNFGEGRFRFRVGDYRVIFKIDKAGEIQILMILNIKHRKEVYLS